MENKFKVSDKTVLPKGKYIVGDLCYLFNDKDWDNFCELLDKEGELLECMGVPMWWSYTYSGDGEYDIIRGANGEVLSNTPRFMVDAGLIGIISVDILEKLGYVNMENIVDKDDSLGGLNIYDIYKDFNPTCVEGTFDINGLIILTKEDGDEVFWM